ncbi:glycosyltransferase, partial [Streptomyces minutiscleroticus]|uniref:glycosyltransferase n=1 Tax=Streptomyces minutiscleroticus TaxID=68238 RepID=UPI003348B235
PSCNLLEISPGPASSQITPPEPAAKAWEAALRRAGLRGILQTGSAGLGADGDDILTIGDVPHTLLFPRPAAVVDHTGAGASAAVLRAAVPVIPVPVTAGQPFRVGRRAALGAATDPVPFRALAAERLADAPGCVVKQRACIHAAATAAHHIATEGGAGHVLKSVQQLPHRRRATLGSSHVEAVGGLGSGVHAMVTAPAGDNLSAVRTTLHPVSGSRQDRPVEQRRSDDGPDGAG